MFRSSSCNVNTCRRFYQGDTKNIFDARRIVNSLRRQYEHKKLEHVTAAEKDKAAIHSMHVLNTSNKHVHLSPYIQHGMDNQDLYGLGYTSTKEV
jgi:hypothetical protein